MRNVWHIHVCGCATRCACSTAPRVRYADTPALPHASITVPALGTNTLRNAAQAEKAFKFGELSPNKLRTGHWIVKLNYYRLLVRSAAPVGVGVV